VARVRITSAPPSGMASTALKMRFVSALTHFAFRRPSRWAESGASSVSTIDHEHPRCNGISLQRARVSSIHLQYQRVQLYPQQRKLRLTLAIELAHVGHG